MVFFVWLTFWVIIILYYYFFFIFFKNISCGSPSFRPTVTNHILRDTSFVNTNLVTLHGNDSYGTPPGFLKSPCKKAGKDGHRG